MMHTTENAEVKWDCFGLPIVTSIPPMPIVKPSRTEDSVREFWKKFKGMTPPGPIYDAGKLIFPELSEEGYLILVERYLSLMEGIFADINKAWDKFLHDNDLTSLKRSIIACHEQYRTSSNIDVSHQNNTPAVCKEMEELVELVYCTYEQLHIVVITKNREDQNVVNCVRMYLKQYVRAIEGIKDLVLSTYIKKEEKSK